MYISLLSESYKNQDPYVIVLMVVPVPKFYWEVLKRLNIINFYSFHFFWLDLINIMFPGGIFYLNF